MPQARSFPDAPVPAPVSPRFPTALVLLLAVALLSARNLPWQLDDYDQAKQAYASWEISHTGAWLYQHTPDQRHATKPPLLAWVSTLLRAWLVPSWDLAWRIPSLLAAFAVVALLVREGVLAWPALGGWIAAAAFVFNVLTPRIATLVRTDMPLAALCFAPGLLIYRKLDRRTPWTRGERALLGALLAVGLLLKGPVVLVFLLPGLLLLRLLDPTRTSLRQSAGGVAPWLLALVPLLAWAIAGSVASQSFFDQVVVAEFLQRLRAGADAVHRAQPPYFYVVHLAQKFAPWSLLLLALPVLDRRVRTRVMRDPATLWLACWALAALAVMSAVPSKRVDRIYPILPPLCLLLPRLLAAVDPACARRWRAAALAATAIAALAISCYAANEVVRAHIAQRGSLVHFGAEARRIIETDGLHPAILLDQREGLLLYAGLLRPATTADARAGWRTGAINALLLPERQLERLLPALSPVRVRLAGSHRDPHSGDTRYYLISPATRRPGAVPDRARTRRPATGPRGAGGTGAGQG